MRYRLLPWYVPTPCSRLAIVANGTKSSVALHSALQSRLPPSKSTHFRTEWPILILPLLLSMTLFANSPGLLILILLFPTSLLLLVPPRESGTSLPSNADRSSGSSSPTSARLTTSPTRPADALIVPLPALTTYRAHMLLLTILSILAVDFPVFPRSLAKCETYGVSLVRPTSILCILLILIDALLSCCPQRWIWV